MMLITSGAGIEKPRGEARDGGRARGIPTHRYGSGSHRWRPCRFASFSRPLPDHVLLRFAPKTFHHPKVTAVATLCSCRLHHPPDVGPFLARTFPFQAGSRCASIPLRSTHPTWLAGFRSIPITSHHTPTLYRGWVLWGVVGVWLYWVKEG